MHFWPPCTFSLKKRNKFNNGGCYTSDGQIDILPEGDLCEIADLLLGLIGFDTNISSLQTSSKR